MVRWHVEKHFLTVFTVRPIDFFAYEGRLCESFRWPLRTQLSQCNTKHSSKQKCMLFRRFYAHKSSWVTSTAIFIASADYRITNDQMILYRNHCYHHHPQRHRPLLLDLQVYRLVIFDHNFISHKIMYWFSFRFCKMKTKLTVDDASLI